MFSQQLRFPRTRVVSGTVVHCHELKTMTGTTDSIAQSTASRWIVVLTVARIRRIYQADTKVSALGEFEGGLKKSVVS